MPGRRHRIRLCRTNVSSSASDLATKLGVASTCVITISDADSHVDCEWNGASPYEQIGQPLIERGLNSVFSWVRMAGVAD